MVIMKRQLVCVTQSPRARARFGVSMTGALTNALATPCHAVCSQEDPIPIG